jgi:predicted DNA-binding transcriptional regulator AlpA
MFQSLEDWGKALSNERSLKVVEITKTLLSRPMIWNLANCERDFPFVYLGKISVT